MQASHETQDAWAQHLPEWRHWPELLLWFALTSLPIWATAAYRHHVQSGDEVSNEGEGEGDAGRCQWGNQLRCTKDVLVCSAMSRSLCIRT